MMVMDANQTTSIVLETKNLDVQVPHRTLIANLTWQVKQGERWCLIGRNGAGKSTLLKIIAGIQAPVSGEVLWLNKSIATYSPESLAKVRAYAEQSPVGGIGLRAIDVVLAAQWSQHESASTGYELAVDALKTCDVAHLANAQWQTLSGGERQRVALAACFAQNTKVLILDEPTSHLDVGHQVSLLNTLIERSHTCQQTVIASLHEIALIGRGFTHALLLMDDGSYMAGAVSEVINPTNLEKSLGHPITEAKTATGQVVYIPA
jgi:iron complex transport system ATP-binding protein